MIVLIAGVALWIGAHSFRRFAPEARARMGEKGKGPIALAVLASVGLMVIGYKWADGPFWWGRTPALVGINNLLVVIAFYFFAAAGMKTRVARAVRHPQLIGFSLWAVAHLLVNGDLPSLILFGGLLGWAVWEMAAGTNPAPPVDGTIPVKKDLIAFAAGIVVTLIVGMIHGWIGPWPFGGV